MGLRVAEPCSSTTLANGAMETQMTRNWLAAYTKARHETVVARQLEAKEVAFLLPTYVKSSQWSDRIKRVLTPLFPSYVFVHVSDEERVRVLQTAGVVNFVSMAGRPSPLCDEEVKLVRECAARPREFEPHPFLHEGQRVKVKHGPFAGWQGVLAYKKNSARLVISVEHLMRSVSVDLAGADVEALN